MSNLGYTILEDFYSRHYDLIESMRTSHHASVDKIGKILRHNPFHLEDVLSHTMMVLNYADHTSKDLVHEEDRKDLLISALLHDVGKPFTRSQFFKREKQEEWVSFQGHELCSALTGLPFILKHYPDYEDRVRLITTICLHTLVLRKVKLSDYLPYDNKTKDLLLDLSECDDMGRITSDARTPASENYTEPWDMRTKEPITSDFPVLTILIGIPGSGKDYYIDRNPQHGKVFSTDKKMLEIAETQFQIKDDYTKAFETVRDAKIDWVKKVQSEMFEHMVRTRESVVYNATNLATKRGDIANKAHSYGYKVRYKMFWRDFSKCRKCRSGEKLISDNIYRGMLSSFVFPTINEYDEIEHIFVNE